ncbi:hypothetical protein [Shewanella woodyi]|uniref:hypothetical protein n=1 Tax=Shewanella woodyi TaxID=60961 RepID=UPI0007F93CEF|nr:hypothetical protein [Shewanella woodyi]
MIELMPHRCFPSPVNPSVKELDECDLANSKRIKQWMGNRYNSANYYTEVERNALAHLLPLLLCGEQSAQLVFNNEINRLCHSEVEDIQTRIKILKEVEAEEFIHDSALQLVQSELPLVAGINDIQRQAKRFYLKLGRVDTYCEHFIRIAILDTCVTQIMHEFEHSKLGPGHPFARLCGLIKKDEAKHVYVAKHHAEELGATKAMFIGEHKMVVNRLYELLIGQEVHFTQLGVHLDKLFERLEDRWA